MKMAWTIYSSASSNSYLNISKRTIHTSFKIIILPEKKNIYELYHYAILKSRAPSQNSSFQILSQQYLSIIIPYPSNLGNNDLHDKSPAKSIPSQNSPFKPYSPSRQPHRLFHVHSESPVEYRPRYSRYSPLHIWQSGLRVVRHFEPSGYKRWEPSSWDIDRPTSSTIHHRSQEQNAGVPRCSRVSATGKRNLLGHEVFKNARAEPKNARIVRNTRDTGWFCPLERVEQQVSFGNESPGGGGDRRWG